MGEPDTNLSRFWKVESISLGYNQFCRWPGALHFMIADQYIVDVSQLYFDECQNKKALELQTYYFYVIFAIYVLELKNHLNSSILYYSEIIPGLLKHLLNPIIIRFCIHSFRWFLTPLSDGSKNYPLIIKTFWLNVKSHYILNESSWSHIRRCSNRASLVSIQTIWVKDYVCLRQYARLLVMLIYLIVLKALHICSTKES